jgi:hypothetical protein
MFSAIGSMNSYTRLENLAKATQVDNSNVLDNTRKSIREAAGVSDKEVEALTNIITGYAEARGGNTAGEGQMVTVGMVQEAVPGITEIKTLANLQNIVLPNSSLSITLTNGFQIFSEVAEIYSNGANNVVLKDNVWLTYANVASVTANAGGNVINITSLTGSYNIVNGGAYSNTQYPLKDIVFAGDKILVANNTEKTVQSVDWEDGIIILTSNLANVVNSLMSVQRTVNTTDVIIYGPVGLQYSPELITQDGDTIATQDNNIITLG